MKKVLIVGGGIAGLIANWVFKQHRAVDVSILEPGKVGGDFLAGGLRYIHATDEMKAMLTDNRITFTNYQVNGGILLKGAVEPYPSFLKTMDREKAERIQFDHYRKTRRTEPSGEDALRSMNDPESVGSRHALRADAGGLLRALESQANVKCDGAVAVNSLNSTTGYSVLGTSGIAHSFDYLIFTIPLWAIRKMVPWELPEALALKLNIVNVDVTRDPLSKWDYVYTPYTPEGLIHRISPRDGGWTAEFNGQWIEEGDETSLKLTSDLNFLFPNGWALNAVRRGLNGHLLPLEFETKWPKNVRPIGRFAEWNSRATADAVLSNCWKLATEWGFERRDFHFD
jgi:hypothetical protein